MKTLLLSALFLFFGFMAWGKAGLLFEGKVVSLKDGLVRLQSKTEILEVKLSEMLGSDRPLIRKNIASGKSLKMTLPPDAIVSRSPVKSTK